MKPRFAVVTVPAHNESAHVAACLASVARSASAAVRNGALDRVHVVTIAHRCDDDTAAVATKVLQAEARSPVTFEVITLRRRAAVGEVRARGVAHGLQRLGTEPGATWIFSTDADTVVPLDWFALGISEAERTGAVATLGMTSLHAWHGTAAAQRAYQDIIERGLTTEPDGSASHTHVYGANLLVRGDAYLAVGGFPRQGHGEDQGLASALVSGGHRVARSRQWVVSTSGRTTGRARQGLADLLHHLDEASRVALRP